MNRQYFYEKNVMTDEDIVNPALEKLPEKDRQEYQELEETIGISRKRVEQALCGNTEALSALRQFEEASLSASTITWIAMFLAGAEIMERECALKFWKVLEALLPSEESPNLQIIP